MNGGHGGSPGMGKANKCGGELKCKSIGGIALHTTDEYGDKVYEHRCAECGEVTDRPTVGGDCTRPAMGKVKP
jgi:hypothetical protein